MKPNIHPQFNTQVTVTCACGNTFVTGSTAKEIYTEICSACHPFYTGKQKLIDTQGRVDNVADATSVTEAVLQTYVGRFWDAPANGALKRVCLDIAMKVPVPGNF